MSQTTAPPARPAADDGGLPIRLGGVTVVAEPSGVLLWPDHRLLAVADLHLEKGSALAARGRMVPPYDTRATLDRLGQLVRRLRPALILCLGDSFHDRGAAERLPAADAAELMGLTREADWVWIAGNHDPEPPRHLGGRFAGEVRLGPLVFRHEAVPGAVGEISGHLHPVARIALPGRCVRQPCFVTDGAKLILPAFGAYTGGLNVLDPAVRGLLGPRFDAQVAARGRLHRFPVGRLIADAR